MATIDASLPELLSRLGLQSAAERLATETLAELVTLLATDGRVALIAALKAKGVEKLAHRQGIANAIERALKEKPPKPGLVSSRTYPEWLVRGQVPRVAWMDTEELHMHLADAKPCIITGGCPFAQGLVGKWTFAHLAEHYGDEAALNCHFAPRTEQRFTRFYGRGLGQGGVARKTDFAAYAAAARANEAQPHPAWRFYVQSSMLWADGDDEELRSVSGGQVSVPAQVCDPTSGNGLVRHAPLGAPLVEDLKALDFDWLAGALRAH